MNYDFNNKDFNNMVNSIQDLIKYSTEIVLQNATNHQKNV